MHSAPSVSFPVGRSRSADRILRALWAAGACCAGTGGYLLDGGVGWRTTVLLGSTILTGAWAARAHSRQPTGQLQFDGQNWSLTGPQPTLAARLVSALDLQSLLLVRLVVAEGGARWLWLERRSDPQRWLALRRAVYSRAPSADMAGPTVAVQRPAGSSPSSP
jgi:toxin CptA